MEKVFVELTDEVNITACMYALGDEKKEIAMKKCRSWATINNQIVKAFEILGVRNGRELSILYSKRVTGKDILKIVSSFFLISLIGIEIYCESSKEFRGSKRLNIEAKSKRYRRSEDVLDLTPLIA